jgi:hypothetical protein
MLTVALRSIIAIATVGQTLLQIPQPIHFSLSTAGYKEITFTQNPPFTLTS